MLLWRQSRPKQRFFLELLLMSCGMHLCALALLFMTLRSNSTHHVKVMSSLAQSDARVVVLPFHKVAPTKFASNRGSSKAASQRVATAEPQGGINLSASPQRKKAEKAKTASVKKTAKVTKTKKQKPPIKLAEKKVPQLKKIEPKKIEPKKSEPVTQPELAALPVIAAQPATVPLATALDVQSHDIVYVGQEELDAMQLQEKIQHEVAQHWKPPCGLGDDLTCLIAVMVNWDGTIESITMQQQSGVLAYDVSARSAVRAMQFPRAAYGKEIVITFKQ